MTDPEGGTAAGDLRLAGVVLSAGTASVPGLTLVVGTGGIAVLGPGPGHRRDIAWSSLEAARVVVPAGRRRDASPVLVLTSGSRTVHFLLPAGSDRSVLDRLSWWVALWSAPDEPVAAAADHGDGTAHRRQRGRRGGRTRQRALLAAGLTLLVAGLGLGVVQTVVPAGRSVRGTFGPRTAGLSDQQLADRLVLTQADVPAGWHVAPDPASQLPPTAHDRSVLASVTDTFARCLGVSPTRGATVLGDRGPDQTAQRSSPVFTGPTSGAPAGLELQTSVAIVRTHADEVADLGPVTSPGFPGCVGTALAAEMQLGVDDVTGGSGTPSGVVGVPVTLPPVPGLQVTGVSATFDLAEGTGPVPVVAGEVVLGTGRVEAQLQLFAVGAAFPSTAFRGALLALEARLVTGGDAVSL